jgi:hypothetical protein
VVALDPGHSAQIPERYQLITQFMERYPRMSRQSGRHSRPLSARPTTAHRRRVSKATKKWGDTALIRVGRSTAASSGKTRMP